MLGWAYTASGSFEQPLSRESDLMVNGWLTAFFPFSFSVLLGGGQTPPSSFVVLLLSKFTIDFSDFTFEGELDMN